jgi:multidrug resistance efflux pump
MGPQINVIGSFFPSWMLCAAIGIVVAVLARRLFLRVGVDPYLGPRALVYPELCASRHPRPLGDAVQGVGDEPPRPGPEIRGHGASRGALLGGSIVAGAAIAVIVTLLQWETRPQTDDATVRANFVGIAPQVSGHIVELPVRDNQQVQEGDLLFVVDPRQYEIALARARANLALTRKEVEGPPERPGHRRGWCREGERPAGRPRAADIVRRETDPVAADAEIARLQAQRAASEAALQRARADLKYSEDYLGRVEQLLPEKFISEDKVEERARSDSRRRWPPSRRGPPWWPSTPRSTKPAPRSGRPWPRSTATRAQHAATEAALRQSRSDRAKAEDSIGQLANTNARIAAAEAAVHSAELDLGYTTVHAPFTRASRQSQHLDRCLRPERHGGVHARRQRNLVRDGELPGDAAAPHSAGASVDLYLQSHPGRISAARSSDSAGRCCQRTAPA